jgi:acyl-CoA synthetase (AMP-forming)/AMP-acid ligase II
MIYVNDEFYSNDYFTARFAVFEQLALFKDCRGQRLAICLEDTAEWIALCLFIKYKGGSVFPVHPATPLDAARRMAHRTHCHALVFQSLDHIIEISNHDKDVVGVLVQMSSGTTGEPKAIARSWDSIDHEINSYVAHFTLAADMTPVVACPVTHSYGLICGVLVALKRGVTPIVVTQINPKYLIRKMLTSDRPVLYASPTLINTLVQLLPAGKRFHAVMTSGAVMPRPWFIALKEKTRFLFQQYGCSEAGCIALSQSLQAANEMGIPLPHVKILAGIDGEHPAEIVVQGETTIYTRDLGYMDSAGVLYFLARIDDTINVAGLNVYPQEVEDVLFDYGPITEAVVYKKSDAYAGERACLKFVASEVVELARLRAWCAKNLAPHQIPLEFQQVNEIPKLPNGKINRKHLLDNAASVSV